MKTKFLQDTPVNIDSFGSHDSIAASLCKIIENNNEGKAISLMGTWGSGKSTIIEILKEKISKEKCHVFLYDAWEHQGDPIRRSLIEEFYKFLTDKSLADKKEFKDDINRIQCKKEVVEVDRNPKINKYGKFALFLLYLVPVGLLLFKSGIEKNQTLIVFPGWNKLSFTLSMWSLYLGVAIVAGPILLALCSWVFGNKNVFTFFTKDIVTTTNTETIKTIEPTALVFKGVYRKLLLKATEKNKIITVIDNLDRLSDHEVLSVWSTMQTLLEVGKENKDVSNNFWLIVPFDSKTPDRVWNSKEHNNNKESVGTRFLNKTFQIHIRVPELRLASWKKYLIDNCKIAFPDYSENEFYKVYRLYEILTVQADDTIYSPTPREIIIFINKIAAIHSQWEEEIPLQVQALYVICEAKIQKPDEDIKGDKLFNNKNHVVKQIIECDDWEKYIAAIHFGVPVDKALNILLSDKISMSISKGICEPVIESNKLYGRDELYVSVIESFSDAELDNIPLINLVRTTDCMNFDNSQASEHVWNYLLIKSERLLKKEKIDDNTINSLSLLIKHCSSDLVRELLSEISKNITDLLQQKCSSENLIQLFDLVDSANCRTEFEDNFSITNSDTYVYYTGILINDIPEEYGKYLLFSYAYDNNDDIVNSIVSHLHWTPICDVCRHFLNIDAITSEELYEALSSTDMDIDDNQKNILTHKNVISIMLILDCEYEFIPAGDYLSDWSTDGTGLLLLHEENELEYLYLLVLILYAPTISPSSLTDNLKKGLASYNAILETPDSKSHLFDDIWSTITNMSCLNKFIKSIKNDEKKEIVSDIILRQDTSLNGHIFTIHQFVYLHQQLYEIYSKNYSNMVKSFISNNDVSFLIAEADITSPCYFYNLILDRLYEHDDCIQKIVTYLVSVNIKYWSSSLKRLLACYYLSVSIVNFVKKGILNENLSSAIKRYIETTSQEGSTFSIYYIKKHVVLLDEQSYRSLIMDILYDFSKFKFNFVKFSICKDLLLDPKSINLYHKDIIFRFFVPLLNHSEYFGVKFVRNYLKDNPDFLKPLSPHYRGKFYQELRSAYNKQTKSKKSGINKIGKILGIKLKNS